MTRLQLHGRALEGLRALGPVARSGIRLARSLGSWLASRPRLGAVVVLLLVVVAAATVLVGRTMVDGSLAALVRRGSIQEHLTETGTLKPAQSITYRSPLSGRETEIIFLAPEGTLVGEGDLLVRLDNTELKRELERAVGNLRQARLDVQLAEVELEESRGAFEALTQGEGALSVDEAESGLRLAEKRVTRLRTDYEGLRPLMDRGFITRDELERAAFELEQAEAELSLARRKAKILVEQTYPRDRQRARVLITQKGAQLENERAQLKEASSRAQVLREAVDGCSIYAREPGLVVYEDFLGAGRRRRIRVGDRVTSSQGLVTIPEVDRMLVETSVREADVHRVRPGQAAMIRLDAFPDLRLRGRVARVGTLARDSAQPLFEDKRFDLIVEVDATEAALRPEMTARVEILVGERRDVVLVPTNAVFERDGEFVCHVFRPFRLESRLVDLGASDGLHVEVLAGLEEGDRVALTDLATAAPGEAPTSPGGAELPTKGLLETDGS